MSDTLRAAIRAFVDAIEDFRRNDPPPPPEHDYGPFIEGVKSTGEALVARLHEREHRKTIRSIRKLCDDVTPTWDGQVNVQAAYSADPLIDELEDLFDANALLTGEEASNPRLARDARVKPVEDPPTQAQKQTRPAPPTLPFIMTTDAADGYRVAVPRGHGLASIPAMPLDQTSPNWQRLSTDEQHLAAATAAERPVMTLCVARETIWDCLIDLRLARTVGQWREFSGRLERVKAVFFGAADDDALRRRFEEPLRVRLVLLGAPREEAERIAPELVGAVLRLRTVGAWRPAPAFRAFASDTEDIRGMHSLRADHDDAELKWRADEQALRDLTGTWRGTYLDDELRAFPDDPPPDPILAARGPRLNRSALSHPPVPATTIPNGFTRQAVRYAQRHVEGLLFLAGAILSRVPHPLGQTAIHANISAEQLDELSAKLRSSWHGEELREQLHRCRSANYSVGGVIKPSVHEAAEELARRVYFAFRSAIGRAVFVDSPESHRATGGPWQWHEVLKAHETIRSEYAGLLTAFGREELQGLESDLAREAAELLSSARPDEPTPDAGAVRTPVTAVGTANGLPLSRLWDNRPLESGSWGNILGFNDHSADGYVTDMRMWLEPTSGGVANPLPRFRPARVPLPQLYRDGGTRRCRIPQPADLDIIRRQFPELADPTNPDWGAVAARLVAAGNRRPDLEPLSPPELLALLDATQSTPPNGVEPPNAEESESEGDGPVEPPGSKRRRIRKDEAEILVRDWLAENAAENPDAVTRDGIAAATGVSGGMVSKTAAWKAFSARREAEANPEVRTIPLTEGMLAVVPDGADAPDELAELIAEQAREHAADERRHKRRHEPS